MVNMNTLRLEVRRAQQQALITRDRMRVDVMAEFYVRVQPTIEAIADAAQTLGKRTMNPESLKELVEGKFVDALRAVAAEMAMEELHEQRVEFVQKVQHAVSEDLLKNGPRARIGFADRARPNRSRVLQSAERIRRPGPNEIDRGDRSTPQGKERHRAGHRSPGSREGSGGGTKKGSRSSKKRNTRSSHKSARSR